MFQVVRKWFNQYFSDPQAVILLILLFVVFGVIMTMGQMLAPVIAALIMAYLLESLVQRLSAWHLPRLASVSFVFIFFVGLSLFVVFALLPLLWQQMRDLFTQFPSIVGRAEELIQLLTDRFPEYISSAQAEELTGQLKDNVANFGQYVLSTVLSSIPGIVVLLVYLILVPLLVFFFLKDKLIIIAWLHQYLPEDRHVADKVWQEMNQQIGNYVRGKTIEIIIVACVTYITLWAFNLQYAAILGVITGFSVLIPYIGAAVVTIPVALIAFFQWGWSPEFAYIMIAYAVIQALDGNLLVPLLFSEAVNLHPVAIIIAVLFFGGIWGFWGVFFAIPLATLVKAVLSAWPRIPLQSNEHVQA